MTRRWLDGPRPLLAFLLASGLLGCGEAAPPPPPRQVPEFRAPGAVADPPLPEGGIVQRWGETSAGRSFYVTSPEGAVPTEVTLFIAGEQAVTLFGCGWAVDVRSIAVDELPGPPALIRVHWKCYWFHPSVDESYGNLVFAPGAADRVLFWDCTPKQGGDSWGCRALRGRYDFAYADGVLSFVEGYSLTDAYCTWGTSDCSATETQMRRRFEVGASGLTLLTCEKLQRAVSPPLVPGQGCGDVYGLLSAAPWEPQPMAPEEAAGRCRVSGGGL